MRLHKQLTAKFKELPSLENERDDEEAKERKRIISFMRKKESEVNGEGDDLDDIDEGTDDQAPIINIINQPLVHNIKSNFSKLKTRAFCVKPTVNPHYNEEEDMTGVSEGSDVTVKSKMDKFGKSKYVSGFMGSRKGLKFGIPLGRDDSYLLDKSELLNMP